MDTQNFEKWVEQWEKAQKDGLFKDAAKPPTPSPNMGTDDYFGNHNRPAEKTSVKDVDAKYWARVYQLSGNQGHAPDPLADVSHEGLTGDENVTLNEDAPVEKKDLVKTTKPDGKTVSAITDDLGKLPNPVHASTRGKDANNRVTPDWAGGEDLIDLNNMKNDLQKLEAKLSVDPMAEGKEVQKVLGQVKTLKDKIDELSDSLTPEFRTEYLS